MDAMGVPDPHWLPRSVGEVIGTGRLPNNLVRALSARFIVTREDGGLLSSYLSSGQGIHAFLGHLTSRVDPDPGLDLLALIGVDRDGTVHVLPLLFSVPARHYSIEWQLLGFSG